MYKIYTYILFEKECFKNPKNKTLLLDISNKLYIMRCSELEVITKLYQIVNSSLIIKVIPSLTLIQHLIKLSFRTECSGHLGMTAVIFFRQFSFGIKEKKLCYTHLNMSTLVLVWISTVNNDCLLYLTGKFTLNHLRQCAARDVFQVLMFTAVCWQAVCL